MGGRLGGGLPVVSGGGQGTRDAWRFRRSGDYACVMSSTVSEVQTELLREQLIRAFLAMLDDATGLQDSAYVEQLAATLLVPLEQFEMPQEVASALLDAIEARGDVDAAGLLAALGVLAAEPLAGRSRAGVQRLADEGIVSPIAAAVGMLAVVDAVQIDGPDAQLLVVLLRRPGAREVQAALLGIEHHDTGDVLVHCALTPPTSIAAVRELLSDGVDYGDAPLPIAAEELSARVLAAARRAVDAEVALGHEAGPAWVIVSRALIGDQTNAPRPAVRAPWDDDPQLLDDEDPDDDEDEDEEGLRREMDLLLEEFEQHVGATYPPDGVVWVDGDWVASSMLQYKGDYADGRLCHWTRTDLAGYLLDYFPRKVTVEEQSLPAVPECAGAFLGFLHTRGSLSGEPLDELVHACKDLRGQFLQRARDRSGWSMTKSILMQMLAEGVDPSAPGAMDAWIADFNARSPEQRDAIIGSAPERMIHAAAPGPATKPRAPKQRTQRRKAQRSARKRNRR